ncbi:MAG: sulfide/dihydroorotate dehydrogenase-like FAD/NAD-binding protein [Candidatus Omnitrophica bacterium]|nr:sulfide/dihydroorotate dehydrogenase-like FAD/NAD-binding protein [Candidatus Omnitrophota bacterium]MDD5591677.1 sulfide/dihydroorotate dehydrogenase-like FAD/NAD-binding protein [Candidatus Omnitrophota bacterium]
MYRIINKQELAQDVTQITLTAAQIAKKAQAGQFVVVVIDEKGERVPLTLADWDKDKGQITLIFQKVGFTTKKLGALNPGDSVQHILGPLGHPTQAKNLGTVICIGGGVGIAEVYPVSRAFKETGNRIIGIIGSRSKELLILEDKMRKVCDELFITTDDGSYQRKGLVTDVLKGLFEVVEKSTHTKYPDLVYCIGPVPMMQAVSEFTRPYRVKTIVSLNPVMVDATGMCGSCRCTVAGKTVFGCVDGPDFDGHEVDFEELGKRLKLFWEQERKLS